MSEKEPIQKIFDRIAPPEKPMTPEEKEEFENTAIEKLKKLEEEKPDEETK